MSEAASANAPENIVVATIDGKTGVEQTARRRWSAPLVITSVVDNTEAGGINNLDNVVLS